MTERVSRRPAQNEVSIAARLTGFGLLVIVLALSVWAMNQPSSYVTGMVTTIVDAGDNRVLEVDAPWMPTRLVVVASGVLALAEVEPGSVILAGGDPEVIDNHDVLRAKRLERLPILTGGTHGWLDNLPAWLEKLVSTEGWAIAIGACIILLNVAILRTLGIVTGGIIGLSLAWLLLGIAGMQGWFELTQGSRWPVYAGAILVVAVWSHQSHSVFFGPLSRRLVSAMIMTTLSPLFIAYYGWPPIGSYALIAGSFLWPGLSLAMAAAFLIGSASGAGETGRYVWLLVAVLLSRFRIKHHHNAWCRWRERLVRRLIPKYLQN